MYECQQDGTPGRSSHSSVLIISFQHVYYSYACTIDYLELHTLHNRRYYCDALFLNQSYVCSKLCLSVLETVGLPVDAW
jgi:hypothetical protein